MVADGICIIVLILALVFMIFIWGIKELNTCITAIIFISVVPIHIIRIAESLGAITYLSWIQSFRVIDTFLLPALWILFCRKTKGRYYASFYYIFCSLSFIFWQYYCL